jgi:hypothetical protein
LRVGSVFTETHYRNIEERIEVGEDREEGVSSYLMTLRKREDTGNLKGKP